MSEFQLIQDYFNWSQSADSLTPMLGVGDDCALLQIPNGQQLAVSSDTLVESVHFLPDCDPEDLGYKSLAVNLSDLAAMGAKPAWFTLALTLPNANAAWLRAFSQGLRQLAHDSGIKLVGGDTTRGPLTIGITVMGLLPSGQALQRQGAKPGDLIYVSGHLGAAGWGLQLVRDGFGAETDFSEVITRYLRPEPRVELGQILLPYATSCIDISDGLASDLSHILEMSCVGASIEASKLPVLPEMRQHLSAEQVQSLSLAAGDDYELCFTIDPVQRNLAQSEWEKLGLNVTCIGQIETVPGLRLIDSEGHVEDVRVRGYDHFSQS